MSTGLQATWEQADLVDALEALRVGGDDLQAMKLHARRERGKGALRDGKTSVSTYASSKLLSRCAPALCGPSHYGSVLCAWMRVLNATRCPPYRR